MLIYFLRRLVNAILPILSKKIGLEMNIVKTLLRATSGLHTLPIVRLQKVCTKADCIKILCAEMLM